MTDKTTNQYCSYPKCNCPFDAPVDPNWCARGLSHQLGQAHDVNFPRAWGLAREGAARVLIAFERPISKEELRHLQTLLATATQTERAVPKQQVTTTGAAQDVLAERERQVKTEGWSSFHDDSHIDGAIGRAGGCYAIAAANELAGIDMTFPPASWPWHITWWKPATARRMLVKAGALILAEIERLDRAYAAQNATKKDGE